MEKILKAPIALSPYLKRVIWGGDGICQYKDMPGKGGSIGESWDVSDIPGKESVVADGPYKGMTITELSGRFGADLLGERSVRLYGLSFPLLVKIIDAHADLSMQVHPDDDLARSRHGSRGKSEMWYVIESMPGSRIYTGFNRKITPEEYERRVAEGTFAEVVQSYESHPGDIFYIPAGRVHAIGAGNLLVEIQEASDVTYRIYDYNRRDADGNLRELHTEQARDAIDYTCLDSYRSPRPGDMDRDSEIVACDHFAVRRLLVDGELMPDMHTDSFTVLICVDGDVVISAEGGEWKIRRGESVLIPAALGRIILKGHGLLLSAQV